jgi:hypothetical protein
MGVLPAPPFSMSGDEQPPRLFAGGLFPVAVTKRIIFGLYCRFLSFRGPIRSVQSCSLRVEFTPVSSGKDSFLIHDRLNTSTSQRSYNARISYRSELIVMENKA